MHPLRLSVGSHQAGSGKGCAMNVVSWENGDTSITDMPACSDPFLALMVQRINDTICTHRDGDLLCPPCSVIVLDLAHRTVGTALAGWSNDARKRLYVQLALHSARSVEHLATTPSVKACNDTVQAWLDGKATKDDLNTAATAKAAYITAAKAAYAAANAAFYAAKAATANAAYANYANYAAYHANAEFAHEMIDMFISLTNTTPLSIPVETTRVALTKMLAKD